MSRLDVYLRSVRQLGAQGAVLSSGQAVTLRFPTGDRHATQITSHDQLVALVREVAPPQAIESLDRGRPVKFEIESSSVRWSVQVTPRPGAWQVAIDPLEAPVQAPSPGPPGPPVRPTPRPPSMGGGGEPSQVTAVAQGQELAIERGQYAGMPGAGTSSGSALLDQLTAAARAAQATDIYLSAGSPAFQRVGGELTATVDRSPIDADSLARELGLVAPNEARSAWTERGLAVFAYGDGAGRVRVTLTRDHRGPGATLRLLPAEAPALAGLGLGGVADWLSVRGLVVVTGASGTGKTTALAALVRSLGERRKRVVSIEAPIEIVHVSPWISQRAVGEHVPSVADGVLAAMREAADAIAIGAIQTAGDAAAVVEAVAAGHLVLATLTAPRADLAVPRMIDRLSPDQRELARVLCADALLGTVGLVMTRAGRSFEVSGRGVVS